MFPWPPDYSGQFLSTSLRPSPFKSMRVSGKEKLFVAGTDLCAKAEAQAPTWKRERSPGS